MDTGERSGSASCKAEGQRSRRSLHLRLSHPRHPWTVPPFITFAHPGFPSLLPVPASGELQEACFTCFFILGAGWVGNSSACDAAAVEMECASPIMSAAPCSLVQPGLLSCCAFGRWCLHKLRSSPGPTPTLLSSPPPSGLSPRTQPHLGLILPPVSSSSLKCPLELSFHRPVPAFPASLFCALPVAPEPSQLCASWTLLAACCLPPRGVLESMLAVLAKSSKVSDSLSLSAFCRVFLPSRPLPTPLCWVLMKGLGRPQ